jgi:hypothetical protein
MLQSSHSTDQHTADGMRPTIYTPPILRGLPSRPWGGTYGRQRFVLVALLGHSLPPCAAGPLPLSDESKSPERLRRAAMSFDKSIAPAAGILDAVKLAKQATMTAVKKQKETMLDGELTAVRRPKGTSQYFALIVLAALAWQLRRTPRLRC